MPDKITQLVVVEREIDDLKHGLAGLPFPLEGWKAYDCVLLLDSGGRFYIRLGGPSEPSYEEISEKFRNSPGLFFRAA
ncbi:MAG: hypothetical protein JWM16_4387 [Verrucomicrobiales bacterium]|nr:hypothetical protein [Verrucomicrobiales bacterium]